MNITIIMGIINKLFGGTNEPKEEKVLPWINLADVKDLDVIAEKSRTKTQLLFKHSTRCGISRMVLKQFEAQYNLDLNADLYFVDLLNVRDVSNEIGYKFQVMHQSPQLVVVKNGVAVAHASHGAINDVDLVSFV